MREKMTQDQKTTVLVTGGAGYIGSHSVLLLLEQDFRVVVVDNCCNSYHPKTDVNGNQQELPESLRRVEELTQKRLRAFYKLDLVSDQLDHVFLKHNIRAVIHFASLKSVSDSFNHPLEYYTNNIVGTINLLNTMKKHGCRRLIFSSSATVYGLPKYLPVDEAHQAGQNILNPYGNTKYMIEKMLQDLCTNDPGAKKNLDSATNGNSPAAAGDWNVVCLRYFNPIGAHPSGYIGEFTEETPNNLMPYLAQVATGKRKKLYVFGDDFDTVDGTGVRDFIHIMDLANGHVHALDYLMSSDNFTKNSRLKVFNLGTGRGYSVLEVIKTFEEVNKVKIPYEVIGRRPGDAGEVYADAKLALQELGWSCSRSLKEMVRDTHRWQTLNPEGFKSCPQPAAPNHESNNGYQLIH